MNVAKLNKLKRELVTLTKELENVKFDSNYKAILIEIQKHEKINKALPDNHSRIDPTLNKRTERIAKDIHKTIKEIWRRIEELSKFNSFAQEFVKADVMRSLKKVDDVIEEINNWHLILLGEELDINWADN